MDGGLLTAPRPARAEPEASDLRIVRNPGADPAGGAAAALSADAVLPHRPSGLDADGLALAHGRADVAAMDRFQRDVALSAALGGGGPRTPNSAAITASTGARCARRSTTPRTARPARGGSTITQQVAKNLFLWPGRSVVRKALEFPLALWIDLVLPKQRILEIYLNIAELGPSGQFGAEAGVDLCLRPFGIDAVAARGGACWRRSCPIRSGAAPGSPARGPAPGRDLYGAGAGAVLQRCWSENRAF